MADIRKVAWVLLGVTEERVKQSHLRHTRTRRVVWGVFGLSSEVTSRDRRAARSRVNRPSGRCPWRPHPSTAGTSQSRARGATAEFRCVRHRHHRGRGCRRRCVTSPSCRASWHGQHRLLADGRARRRRRRPAVDAARPAEELGDLSVHLLHLRHPARLGSRARGRGAGRWRWRWPRWRLRHAPWRAVFNLGQYALALGAPRIAVLRRLSGDAAALGDWSPWPSRPAAPGSRSTTCHGHRGLAALRRPLAADRSAARSAFELLATGALLLLAPVLAARRGRAGAGARWCRAAARGLPDVAVSPPSSEQPGPRRPAHRPGQPQGAAREVSASSRRRTPSAPAGRPAQPLRPCCCSTSTGSSTSTTRSATRSATGCWSRSATGCAGWCARGDLVARLGGDEFAIAGAAPDGPAEARELAERIAAALAEPVRWTACRSTSPARSASRCTPSTATTSPP